MIEHTPAYRRPIALVMVFSIFTNILMLTGPLFMLQIYDRVLSARSEETLLALSILVAGLYLIYWLLEFARARVMSRVGARFQAGMNRATFSRVIERRALKKGSSKGTLNDIDAIRAYYTSPVFLAMMDAPWTPLFIAAIFIFHPLLGWVAVAGGSILILAAILNQLLTARKTRESGAQQMAAHRFARQTEEASEFVWAQGMKQSMMDRWVTMQDAAVAKDTRATDWTGAFSSFTRAFRLFLQSAMLAVGAWLVLQGELTAGAMIAASIVLGRALAPVEIGVSQWQVAQRAWIARRDLARLQKEMPDTRRPLELPRPTARLSVSGVSVMAENRERPVLSGISFEVGPGQVLGIIGKSGSGKSSLARAVMGLSRLSAGEVRLDGATIDQFSSEALGDYIGYLPQNVQMLSGTVAENIAHMRADTDAQKVVEAARKARVHDVILKLPKGYETQLGDGLHQLSGGQMQRVALARALYADPEILILDEPNSALDNDGSEALNAALEEMKAAGKAALIMTHRATAIATCDEILVLEDGRVKAYGPKDDVLKSTLLNTAEVKRIIKERRG